MIITVTAGASGNAWASDEPEQVERQMGEHLQQLGEAGGKRLRVSFTNPDYVVASETMGVRCGVALFDRAFRERFSFVLPH